MRRERKNIDIDIDTDINMYVQDVSINWIKLSLK